MALGRRRQKLLPANRLNRFARHIVLPELGGAGQSRIAASHIVLVGMGGIGNPALQYLAGAGVGRLTLIDDDVVEEEIEDFGLDDIKVPVVDLGKTDFPRNTTTSEADDGPAGDTIADDGVDDAGIVDIDVGHEDKSPPDEGR